MQPAFVVTALPASRCLHDTVGVTAAEGVAVDGSADSVCDGIELLISPAWTKLAHSVDGTPPVETGYPRESNDTPSEKAFCRVAPSVLLSDFAILAAGVF